LRQTYISFWTYLNTIPIWGWRVITVHCYAKFSQKQNSKTRTKHDEIFHSPPRNVVQWKIIFRWTLINHVNIPNIMIWRNKKNLSLQLEYRTTLKVMWWWHQKNVLHLSFANLLYEHANFLVLIIIHSIFYTLCVTYYEVCSKAPRIFNIIINLRTF
jgi:hypothetical protein